jgi:uncharacterized membrane protein YccC
MSEVSDILDVNQEVIPPEQEQALSAEDSSESPVEDLQDKNWKMARARIDEQQRKLELAQHQQMLMAQELEHLRRQQQAPAQPDPEEELLTDSERKLYREIQALKQQVAQRSQPNLNDVERTLKRDFPDYHEVVNEESVKYLATNNRALAKALASLKEDPYEQGTATYEAIKASEWYRMKQTLPDKLKAEENSKKPMSVQAVRKQGPLAEANLFVNGLTPELKKHLLAEMAAARKGA